MKIVISAGELSGDEHGAGLARALQDRIPGVALRGMGLRNLRQAGMELVVDAEKTGAVMGFTEVLAGGRRILSAWRQMKQLLADWKPDALVIINYSEFNLHLARVAKGLGIRVMFYIPPQVWAWRAGRVKKIDRYVDTVVCIYPFERAFYESKGCSKAVFVGHPFVDLFRTQKLPKSAQRQLLESHGFDPGKPVVALFPGSRRKEIHNHLEFIHRSFRLIRQQVPEMQGMLVSANASWAEEIKSKLPADSGIRVVHGDSLALLQCAAIGLIKSGTSNLQATFAGVPFFMYYTGSYLNALLVRVLVPHMKYFSIVNILRPGTVREMAKTTLVPETAANELVRLFRDVQYRETQLQGFREIVSALSTPDALPGFEQTSSASDRAALLVLEMIK